MKLPSKNMIIAVATGIVLVGGALYVLLHAPSSATITSGTPVTSAAEATFLGLAAQLDSISFDTSVLSDPRFLSLTDIRTAILPEAAGRVDPFAQLTGLSATQ